MQVISQDQSERGELSDEMRLQYVATISALAEQFNVPNLEYPDVQHVYIAYRDFSRAAQAEVARITARNRRTKQTLSVQLTPKTRARIEQQIASLRRAIEESDLPDSRKNALYAKLGELTAELTNRRIGFGKIMAILAVVAAGVGNLGASIAGVAEAPAALTNIMRLIGNDKVAEDAEAMRLAAPVRALPAPPAPAKAPTRGGDGPSWEPPKGDLDDEIPF